MINDSFLPVYHNLYIFVLHRHLLLLDYLTSRHSNGLLTVHIVAEGPRLWEIRRTLRLVYFPHMMMIMLILITIWVSIAVLRILILLLISSRYLTNATLLELLLRWRRIPKLVIFSKARYVIAIRGEAWLSLEAASGLHIKANISWKLLNNGWPKTALIISQSLLRLGWSLRVLRLKLSWDYNLGLINVKSGYLLGMLRRYLFYYWL